MRQTNFQGSRFVTLAGRYCAFGSLTFSWHPFRPPSSSPMSRKPPPRSRNFGQTSISEMRRSTPRSCVNGRRTASFIATSPSTSARSKTNRHAWGLYDMHGNVWERCLDWRDESTPTDATDPSGPPNGMHRVNRGGSWSDTPQYGRSAFKGWNTPDAKIDILGFRVVRKH